MSPVFRIYCEAYPRGKSRGSYQLPLASPLSQKIGGGIPGWWCGFKNGEASRHAEVCLDVLKSRSKFSPNHW